MVCALYSNTTVRVRNGNSLSDAIQVLAGVRQGCPLSPILFVLFIDDLSDCFKMEEGVAVPGVNLPISNLLFADDVVVLAESDADLQALATKVEAWSKTWGMKFGLKKTNTMIVTTVN